MSIFFEENGCKVYKGDCEAEMKGLDESSIDLVLTDPPYGYSFMGKDWDKAVPKVEVWKRVPQSSKARSFLSRYVGSKTGRSFPNDSQSRRCRI